MLTVDPLVVKCSLVAAVLGPRIKTSIEYLKDKGTTKIGIVGFCWWGTVVCKQPD
jgi:dienelactone hydrolase